VKVITPVRPVTVSPPRSVLDALSGFPSRPEHDRVRVLGLQCVVDDDPVRRLFSACRARAGAPGSTTLVGWASRPPGRHHHLAEPTELEVLGDREVLRERDEHALVALERRSGDATGSSMSRSG
jgi:hypothetical protein